MWKLRVNFEFSVGKDMKSMLHKKVGGIREGSSTFMSIAHSSELPKASFVFLVNF